mmetsp:Transcript_165444/g.530879  ORF Transcript_165444/g.530879 Transcript_165444/m.530879 type:complete len:232 (-) Transcript_165444:403-1098(-)
MSTPVTSSVIVCSTWMRGFTSMKINLASGFVKSSATMNSTVPTPWYSQFWIRRTAQSVMRWRRSGCMRAGATSTTFWFRICTEQSRSKRWTTPPRPSETTCTSMWRASCRNSSKKTAPLPKAVRASLVQLLKALSSSDCFVTKRMPRPPPPKAALKIIGRSMLWSKRYCCACSAVSMNGDPRKIGTWLASASSRARTLSPSSAIVSALGPMNLMPLLAHSAENSALSLRKP